jgi:hypothetical protein
MPTVLFNPVFGAETINWRAGNAAGMQAGSAAASPITYNPAALQNPQVYLIFYGPTWTPAIAQQYATDVQTIANSQYLSALTQYGSDGRATFNATTDWTVDPTPTTRLRDAEIQYILDNQMTSWTKPTGLATYAPGGPSNAGSAFLVSARRDCVSHR